MSAERPTRRWELIATAAVFVAVYSVLLYLYRPDLLLALTTTSGGDMGAHHFPAQFMAEELLPRFKLTGWTFGWYAGMPMFTFYLPFPFLLIAVTSLVIPYEVAFKLVTVLGVFLLPAAAYLYMRLLRYRLPFPEFAAVFALIFLLMGSFSIYGGNILSTLAGEFGYSLAFALIFIFLGTLARGMEKPRLDLLFVLNCALLTAIVLSHIVIVIMLVIIVPSLLLLHHRRRSFFYLVGVFLMGFFLTAFWGFPFLDKLSWTAHMSWGQLESLGDILPLELRPVAALAVLGIAYAVSKRDIRQIPIIWTVAAVAVLFFTLPDGRMWNGRLVPFFYFGAGLLAAYAAAHLTRPFVVLSKDLLGLGGRSSRTLYAPLVALGIGVALLLAGPTASGWINWNYSGYERKDPWPQLEEIMDTLDSQPPGRVMWEHSPDLDKFGTPRVFELIPYWTSQATMEGTLMESAFTAPYHFINQAELSTKPSHAIIGVDYPARNTEDGLTHLQFMNIPYLLTVSEEVTSEVSADPRTDLLAEIGLVSIFRVAGAGGYVEVMDNEPVRVQTDDWRAAMVPWYKSTSALKVPVIWDRGEPGLEGYELISPEETANPPVVPTQAEGQVLSEQLDHERLQFETTAIGQPHWIKVSYFPNWKVEGADGPYVVSPSFIMVIPRERTVTLTYGNTLSNTVGQITTGLGWLFLAGVVARVVILRRRRKGASGRTASQTVPSAAPQTLEKASTPPERPPQDAD